MNPEALSLLILQHPQERKNSFNTVSLLQDIFPTTTVKIGLSFGSLSRASDGASQSIAPKDWVVLYPGSLKQSQEVRRRGPGIYGYFKGGRVEPLVSDLNQRIGLILLDGSWPQGKTLWWRNSWLTKIQKAIVIPTELSPMRSYLKEPRPECVSTFESAVYYWAFRTMADPIQRASFIKDQLKRLEVHLKGNLPSRPI